MPAQPASEAVRKNAGARRRSMMKLPSARRVPPQVRGCTSPRAAGAAAWQLVQPGRTALLAGALLLLLPLLLLPLLAPLPPRLGGRLVVDDHRDRRGRGGAVDRHVPRRTRRSGCRRRADAADPAADQHDRAEL